MRLILYTRRGCHLCEEMVLDLDLASRRGPLSYELVDIDTDPGLVQLYGLRVPVLVGDGLELCAGRVDAAVLEKILEK